MDLRDKVSVIVTAILAVGTAFMYGGMIIAGRADSVPQEFVALLFASTGVFLGANLRR